MTIGTYILVSLIKIVIAMFVLLTGVAYTTLAERKVVAHIQNRWGPSRVGPFGIWQPLADGLKFIFKEDITPPFANKPLYLLAPILSLTVALTAIAVVPIGPWVTIGGIHTPLQIADVNIGLLIILGLTSIGVYGVALAGWSSNSKYSMLGSLRASAQMVSYEIALGLSLVGVLIYAGSFSLRDIVNAQSGTFLGIHSQVEHLYRTVRRLLYLHHGGVRRNQPHSVRSGGSGDGIRRRLSHGIQLDEVCHVLHGRVRQHVHRRVPGYGAVLWRMVGPGVSDRRFCRPCCPCFWFVVKVLVFIFIYIWVRGTLAPLPL